MASRNSGAVHLSSRCRTRMCSGCHIGWSSAVELWCRRSGLIELRRQVSRDAQTHGAHAAARDWPVRRSCSTRSFSGTSVRRWFRLACATTQSYCLRARSSCRTKCRSLRSVEMEWQEGLAFAASSQHEKFGATPPRCTGRPVAAGTAVLAF